MSVRKPMSKKLRFEVFKRDGFACQYCGATAPDVRLHVDHIVPVAKGGDDDMSNLTTACVDCNHGKAANFHDPLLKRINDLESEVKSLDAFILELRDAIWRFKEIGIADTERLLHEFGLSSGSEGDFDVFHDLIWKIGYSDACDQFAVLDHELSYPEDRAVLAQAVLASLRKYVAEAIAGHEAVLA